MFKVIKSLTGSGLLRRRDHDRLYTFDYVQQASCSLKVIRLNVIMTHS